MTPPSMRDTHRQRLKRSCRSSRTKTPRNQHCNTLSLTRGTHGSMQRTHTHTRQATSFSSTPRFTEQSTNALKTTSTQASESEPLSHRMHTNAIIKVQHRSYESIPNHQSSRIGRIQANVSWTKKPFKPEKQRQHQTHACDWLTVSMLRTKQIRNLKKGK